MSDEFKAKLLVNCIGLHCPIPAVKLSLALKEVNVGEIIELIATDEATQKDVPAVVESKGNELLKSFSLDKTTVVNGVKYEKEFHYFVRRLK